MKQCEICQGLGVMQCLNGDGFGGEITCEECLGIGKIYDPQDPDHERDIKEN